MWFENPDQLNLLEFPKTYALNQEFNDKGLIYIRHGEPDNRALTVGEEVPLNESWLYYQSQANPRMTFHFMLGKSGNDWRFAPIIANQRMLADRLTWGNIYSRLLRADELDRLHYKEEMAEESRQSVATGLATDRHTWEDNLQPLKIPLLLATFRGDQGRTILELYYELPLSRLTREVKIKDQEVEVERGIIIYDQRLQPVVKDLGKLNLHTKESGVFIGMYCFTLPPDLYNMAFHARPIGINLVCQERVVGGA